MTPEREADIRARAAVWPVAMVDAVDLLAEVDRLRALPVIATCGDCRRAQQDIKRWRCEHPGAPRLSVSERVGPGPTGDCPSVDPYAAPPTWCPLRGAR